MGNGQAGVLGHVTLHMIEFKLELVAIRNQALVGQIVQQQRLAHPGQRIAILQIQMNTNTASRVHVDVGWMLGSFIEEMEHVKDHVQPIKNCVLRMVLVEASKNKL